MTISPAPDAGDTGIGYYSFEIAPGVFKNVRPTFTSEQAAAMQLRYDVPHQMAGGRLEFLQPLRVGDAVARVDGTDIHQGDWDAALAYWQTLVTDEDAEYDEEIVLDAGKPPVVAAGGTTAPRPTATSLRSRRSHCCARARARP